MAIIALNTAASGMDAMQFKLDVIANNMANAQTTAFKSSRVNFEDLYYQNFKLPGNLDQLGRPTALGLARGLGVRVQSTELNMEQGSLLDTGRPLDVAIVGQGFFQVNDGNRFLYTRAGNFAVNANGEIVVASADRGRPLEPSINIPQDTLEIQVSSDGIVSVLQAGQSQLTQIGQLQLARFINPQGLVQMGENLYSDSVGSGTPLISTPGQDGLGTLRQRYLEASNTEPVREIVDLITTQRVYELNSQVVQVADQTLQLIANLRRF